VGFARARGDGKTMQEKLANELLDAANLRGAWEPFMESRET
jgi:ribosomal protein S7